MNQLYEDMNEYQYNYYVASISQAISTTLWVLLLFIPLIQVSVCIICMYIILWCCYIIMLLHSQSQVMRALYIELLQI